ncbi:hypothetical protein OC835_006680 [Tilletia horrida]|nr:hypothetical protein OC835_006680 [Tilletia horrida]
MAETQEQKLEKGIAYKDEGNQHFKDGEWQKAIASYHHAGLYLAGIVSEGSKLSDLIAGNGAGGGVGSDELTESRKQLSIVRNNMAACFLKLEKYTRAIQCADQCLAIDPSNLKASYRKLQALRLSKDIKYKTFLDELLAKYPQEEMLRKEFEEWKVEDKKKSAEADKKMSGFLNRKRPAAAASATTASSSEASSSTASGSASRPTPAQRPVGAASAVRRTGPVTRQ